MGKGGDQIHSSPFCLHGWYLGTVFCAACLEMLEQLSDHLYLFVAREAVAGVVMYHLFTCPLCLFPLLFSDCVS